MNDPLEEAENRQERLYKSIHRVESEEERRKIDRDNWEIDRLPYWLSPLADYLPEDSGMHNGDNDVDEK